MAKGASGGRRGGVAKGELTLPDGTKIEFDGELRYGGKDAAVPDAVREKLDAWETNRYKNKIEYAMAWNEDGEELGKESRGGNGSVKSPYSYHSTPNSIFSHNHPRGEGMLGGTFSDDDLRNFANGNNKTMRATAKEGTYSISRGKNFDADGFKQHVSKSHNDFVKAGRTSKDKIQSDYNDGKITYEQATLKLAKDFNSRLVSLHQSYLDGQKKYGYKYTLEKRG